MIHMSGSSVFVFVHGAWGCGAVWSETEQILRRLGHKTVALDLPAHGMNYADIREQTTETYAAYVSGMIQKLGRKVILVGHSMGGSVITAAAERIPESIEKLVYCAAFLLRSGESGNGLDGQGIQPVDWLQFSSDKKSVAWEAYLQQNPTSDTAQQMVTMEGARFEALYNEGAAESIAALQGKVYPTPERWGSIPRYYIATAKDNAITPDLQAKMLANLPCREVYEIGTDHFPLLAAPVELAVILHDIARK